MNREEAAAVLGVAPDASREEAHGAYRRLVRRHHPDVAGAGAEGATATDRTAALTQAWSVLQQPAPPASAPPPTEPRRPPGPVQTEPDHDEPVAGGAPAGFLALLDAASALGEVTWADRAAQMVQVIVQPDPDGPTCQLLASLVPIDGGWAVRCALESLENREAPPLEPLAEQLAALVAAAAG